MPSVKITELPILTELSANNANTVFVAVDKTTNTTSQFSTTTLAAGLFANNILNVGTETASPFPGLIAQFVANTEPYGQVNFENANTLGSMDVVLTADIGDNANNYLDLGINNSGYVDPLFSSTKAADGYLFVHGSPNSDYVGNLVLGTAQSETNVIFSVGGTTNLDIVAKITKNGLEFDNGSYIKFNDGSTQTLAASPANYSQAAFAKANTNSILAQASFDAANTAASNTILSQSTDITQNTRLTVIEGTDVSQNARITIVEGTDTTQNTRLTVIEGVNVGQNTAIAATNDKMQSAYNKANNALANTTGTFEGSLTITRDLVANGIVSIGNTGFSATEAALTISASNNASIQPPNGDGYMIHLSGKYNVPTRFVSDSFGANGQICFPAIVGRAARGNVTNPTAIQTNDILMRVGGASYGTTQYQTGGSARIDIVASENHTDAARGTQIRFYNISNGSNTISQIASFNANSAEFFGTVNPQKGFVYSPNVIHTGATTLTVDFVRDSFVKANSSGGLTVSFANYVTGKEVIVWFQNQSGATQTVTHGCLANNSTTGSTSFTVPGNQTILMRYFSIDADSSDVYVAVIK